MAYLYFPKELAIRIHDKIISISGGHTGIKDLGNIESPLYHIQNDDYYPYLEDKLTHLVFCFNKFHAFNDGNKRTSIALGAFFLQVNGLGNFVNKFIIEMENVAVAVADNIIDKELLFEIITSIVYEDDYNEVLKIKIFDALDKANRDIDPDLYENNVFWGLY
ncbi:type II toxin-antitoxin system death-on-curing family toxin [Elizabethkingia anophelis]|uniref:type II toxin-antitoxin system death-on-curing family toxin n=1 Tax=Elizabethkingia anophelis TaxID=1117645 RepID=UPI0021A384DE|nr:type II toxin-antitoxin system death-on-curing family toxin [Elizabethkingia anophelis]MCT3633692.1 type II toxin-antitoxin system death-on-curing family toxin [Elizabethkingia anophelis]MCT3830375.1 type II toxin-antitoxin system death-on-curing family toxin [Elizabethkingia anophelis]MCT3883896.1 type II toxin-antitoxin system death-on-curing family toxin [Elizabethkingia anophelis]MCT3894664.1 type II toxin-antitoxin system death-on-curing family toxin [Elizabethkingia anophelis]